MHNRAGDVIAYVIVDAEDYEWLAQWSWTLSHGYAHRRQRHDGNVEKIYMHRQILGLAKGDGLEADHVNGVKLDNRRANLRIVTHAENSQNQHLWGRGTSEHRGVSWDRRRRRWRAQAAVAGHKHFLGAFKTEAEAVAAVAHFRRENMPFDATEAVG